MNNTLSEEIKRELANALADIVTQYYTNPENERKFQERKKERLRLGIIL